MNNEEVYASTLALKTFRILLAIICHFDWITLQLDAHTLCAVQGRLKRIGDLPTSSNKAVIGPEYRDKIMSLLNKYTNVFRGLKLNPTAWNGERGINASDGSLAESYPG
jgi:hypothetical protein